MSISRRGLLGSAAALSSVPLMRARAQALVELGLVMPLLVGIVMVLFQFGVLFVIYLSIVHDPVRHPYAERPDWRGIEWL